MYANQNDTDKVDRKNEMRKYKTDFIASNDMFIIILSM